MFLYFTKFTTANATNTAMITIKKIFTPVWGNLESGAIVLSLLLLTVLPVSLLDSGVLITIFSVLVLFVVSFVTPLSVSLVIWFWILFSSLLLLF